MNEQEMEKMAADVDSDCTIVDGYSSDETSSHVDRAQKRIGIIEAALISAYISAYNAGITAAAELVKNSNRHQEPEEIATAIAALALKEG